MQRLLYGWIICAALVAALASARPALAQVGELEAHAEGKPLLALELGLFGDGDFAGINGFSVFHLSPFVRFFYPLSDSVMLSADWGFTHISISDDDGNDDSDFRTGNIFVGVHYVHHGRDLRFRIGGGLTLPIANIPDIDGPGDFQDAIVAALAYGVAIASRGAWDIWLWLPETVSVAVPFRLEKELAPAIDLGVDAGLGLLFPIADNNGDTELFLEGAGEIAFWLSQHVRLGFRLQFGWIPSDDDAIAPDDNFQLSFEPVLRGEIGRGFLQARLVINLDEPAGFAFDDDGVWGLFLGGGLTF